MAVLIVLVSAWAVTPQVSVAGGPTSGLQAEIETAFARADSLSAVFEYEEAARTLERLLSGDIPIETRIAINTRLASTYEKDYNEQEAIRRLLDNLRSRPSYEVPASLRTQLQRLYEKALDIYRDEESRRNHAPRLSDVPADRDVTAGESLEFTIKAADPDGDALTYTVSGLPEDVLRPATDGGTVFSFTAPANGPDMISVWFKVTDGELSDSARTRITIRSPAASPPSYVLKSLILPGGGQRAAGKKGLGAAFLIGEIVAVGASVITTLGYNSAVDDYNDALDRYRQATVPHEIAAAWYGVEDTYATVEDAAATRNLMYLAAAGIYAVNLIHAATIKPESAADNEFSGRTRPLIPRLAFDGKGIVLRLRF